MSHLFHCKCLPVIQWRQPTTLAQRWLKSFHRHFSRSCQTSQWVVNESKQHFPRRRRHRVPVPTNCSVCSLISHSHKQQKVQWHQGDRTRIRMPHPTGQCLLALSLGDYPLLLRGHGWKRQVISCLFGTLFSVYPRQKWDRSTAMLL